MQERIVGQRMTHRSGGLIVRPRKWLGSDMKRKSILFVVVSPHRPPESNLLEIVFAESHSTFFFGLGQRRQKQRRKDRNHRDNNQQLDQRKPRLRRSTIPVHGLRSNSLLRGTFVKQRKRKLQATTN